LPEPKPDAQCASMHEKGSVLAMCAMFFMHVSCSC